MTSITLNIVRRGLPNDNKLPAQVIIRDNRLVSRLKSDIENTTGIPSTSQILWFGNAKLVEGNTLRNSGLTNGQTVELQDIDCIRIYVYRATASVTQETQYALRSETLGQIKTRILGASEVPKYDTQIGSSAALVEPPRDGTNIINLGVSDDTIIRFHARADGG